MKLFHFHRFVFCLSLPLKKRRHNRWSRGLGWWVCLIPIYLYYRYKYNPIHFPCSGSEASRSSFPMAKLLQDRYSHSTIYISESVPISGLTRSTGSFFWCLTILLNKESYYYQRQCSQSCNKSSLRNPGCWISQNACLNWSSKFILNIFNIKVHLFCRFVHRRLKDGPLCYLVLSFVILCV